MKALVLFRSHYGNTRQVAEAIAQRLGELGWESDVRDIRQKLPDLGQTDLIFIGAPTIMKRVGGRSLRVIRALKKRGFGSKPLAIFDTCGTLPTTPEEMAESGPWVIPGAAGILHRVAKEQGLNVHEETLRCEVKGAKGPLASNALERAKAFAGKVVAAIH
jgi:flavodoxin